MVAAFAHQCALSDCAISMPTGLQFHQFGEDVGRAVEQRAGQHRALDALAARGVSLRS
jgi:hypothetical protein